jgi:hypothetical protein
VLRLICVNGKNAEQNIILKEGDNIIGRESGSSVLIKSGGVSKKHAVINVSNNQAIITDLNSKNGVFVNGILVRKKDLNIGDKIAIYDHVFQLAEGVGVDASKSVIGVEGLEDNIEYKARPKIKATGFKAMIDNLITSTIMPSFEFLMKRYTVSIIISIVLVLSFLLVALSVSIPIIKFDELVLSKEASQRGIYLVKLLVQHNKSTISDDKESPSIEAIRDVPGVKSAFISDPEGRILAPSEFIGNQLPGVAINRIKFIIEGGAKTYKEISSTGADTYRLGSDRFLITAPIEGFSQEQDKVEYLGFSVIEYETSAIKQSLVGAKQRVLVGMIIAGFVAVIISFLLAKLFNIPFDRIYNEIDMAMKGDVKRVHTSYKSNSIIDFVELINILVRKARKADISTSADYFGPAKGSLTDEVQLLEAVGNSIKSPFVVLDEANAVVVTNPAFNNISTYRTGSWAGVPIVEAIKEQQLLGAILNLISRYSSMGEDLSEDVMINERLYRVALSGVKDDSGDIKYYCINVEMV